jgi:hypothetical protein
MQEAIKDKLFLFTEGCDVDMIYQDDTELIAIAESGASFRKATLCSILQTMIQNENS